MSILRVRLVEDINLYAKILRGFLGSAGFFVVLPTRPGVGDSPRSRARPLAADTAITRTPRSKVAEVLRSCRSQLWRVIGTTGNLHRDVLRINIHNVCPAAATGIVSFFLGIYTGQWLYIVSERGAEEADPLWILASLQIVP